MNDVKWDMVPLGLVAEFHTGWTPPSGDDKYYGGGHKWANISDVGSRDLYETERTISDYALERQAGAKPANPGDLLFPFKLSIGAVSFAREKMYTNEAIAVFPPNEKFDLRFFYYALPYFLLQNAGVNIYGAPLLNATLIKQARVPVPPLESQHRIADFLDRETAEIDAAVADLNRYVELMEMRRGIVITNTLLGRNSESTKPDAHEIIGDHVEISLKHYAEVNPLTPEFKELVDGEEITFLPLESIWAFGSADYSRSRPWKKSDTSYTQFRRGDILVPKVTPTVFHGRSMVAEMESNIGLASSEVHILRPKPSVESRWVAYNVLSSQFLDRARGEVYGVGGLQRISAGYLGSYKVARADPTTQRRMADFLDREMAEIDSLIAKSTKLRDLLLKRRSVLITEVVTGRKQV